MDRVGISLAAALCLLTAVSVADRADGNGDWSSKSTQKNRPKVDVQHALFASYLNGAPVKEHLQLLRSYAPESWKDAAPLLLQSNMHNAGSVRKSGRCVAFLNETDDELELTVTTHSRENEGYYPRMKRQMRSLVTTLRPIVSTYRVPVGATLSFNQKPKFSSAQQGHGRYIGGLRIGRVDAESGRVIGTVSLPEDELRIVDRYLAHYLDDQEACSESPEGQRRMGLIIFDMQYPPSDLKQMLTRGGATARGHIAPLNNGLGIIIPGRSKRGVITRATAHCAQHPHACGLAWNVVSMGLSAVRVGMGDPSSLVGLAVSLYSIGQVAHRALKKNYPQELVAVAELEALMHEFKTATLATVSDKIELTHRFSYVAGTLMERVLERTEHTELKVASEQLKMLQQNVFDALRSVFVAENRTKSKIDYEPLMATLIAVARELLTASKEIIRIAQMTPREVAEKMLLVYIATQEGLALLELASMLEQSDHGTR